jgi:hypothetical protein
VPRANATEAALTPRVEILAADDLPAVLRYLGDRRGLEPEPLPELPMAAPPTFLTRLTGAARRAPSAH